MNWYYKQLGGHTHVRVFMNGGKCGDLCFRNEEFEKIQEQYENQLDYLEGDTDFAWSRIIDFIPDTITD